MSARRDGPSSDGPVRRAASGSRFLDGVDLLTGWRRFVERLLRRPVTTGSWTVRLARAAAVPGSLDDAARSSRLATVVSTVERWVATSVAFRWLTAEPDPEVVVVDLRETFVFGPIVAGFDGMVGRISDARSTSRAYRTYRDVEAYVHDAPIRAASIAVLGATALDLAVELGTGTLTAAGVLARLGLAGVAVLGLRSGRFRMAPRDSKAVRFLVSALEPPEPPESPDRGGPESGGDDRAADGRDPNGTD